MLCARSTVCVQNAGGEIHDMTSAGPGILLKCSMVSLVATNKAFMGILLRGMLSQQGCTHLPAWQQPWAPCEVALSAPPPLPPTLPPVAPPTSTSAIRSSALMRDCTRLARLAL